MIVCATLAALVGCAENPTRDRPQPQLQGEWEGVPANTARTAGATTKAWWKAFDDPVLSDLINRADAQNLDIRIAAATIDEARALRESVAAARRPAINGAVDVTRVRSAARRFDSGGIENNFFVGLDAAWEVDLFGRLRNQVEAAEADIEAAIADRDGIRLALLAEVARSYVEYRLYRVQAEISEKTAAAQAETVRITRARYEQGVAGRLDLERTQALLATTRAQLPQSIELAEAARYRLALLLATTPETVAQSLAQTRALPDSDPLEVLRSPAEVIALRPDVQAAEQRLIASTELTDAARALRYPRITLAGLLGLESRNIGDLFNPASHVWSIGAGLLAPLFDFGRIRAEIDAADARAEQAYLNYERTVRVALQEAQTAIVSYAQGAARQRELGDAVESARAAVALARRQYQEGVLALLDVLDTERTLYAAELDWSRATADVSLRLIAAYRTMGIIPPATPSPNPGGDKEAVSLSPSFPAEAGIESNRTSSVAGGNTNNGASLSPVIPRSAATRDLVRSRFLTACGMTTGLRIQRKRMVAQAGDRNARSCD